MLPTMGEGHSPLAQVVQAVLGFHVDQWDPGTDAVKETEHNINSSLFEMSHKTATIQAAI